MESSDIPELQKQYKLYLDINLDIERNNFADIKKNEKMPCEVIALQITSK